MILHNPILHSTGVRGVCGTIRTETVFCFGRSLSHSRHHGQALNLFLSRDSIKVLDDFTSNPVHSTYIQRTQQAAYSNNNSRNHISTCHSPPRCIHICTTPLFDLTILGAASHNTAAFPSFHTHVMHGSVDFSGTLGGLWNFATHGISFRG